MPHDRRNLIVWVIATLIALLPVVSASARQDAGVMAMPVSRAGLVVQHGDGSLTYAVVAFPEATISGLDLLGRSGIGYLSVPFGGLGEGVCQIETEGCEVSECRRTVCQATRSSPYWQYFDQVDAAGWRAAPLGASGSRVADGDVLAWAWAAGTPALPELDLAGVAAAAGLDAGELATFGQSDATSAAVQSGFTVEDGTVETGPLIGGIAALLLIAAVGSALLVLRRQRVAGS